MEGHAGHAPWASFGENVTDILSAQGLNAFFGQGSFIALGMFFEEFFILAEGLFFDS